ncbi:DUF1376 domain-containing protein [Achromobacter xylosoxidans]|uniref:DUF1376 domain-containing protein n=1 Tax=Achromobacter xylosoxidans (strain A8) TaxID=762376 RepID=E3HGP7_ACHXA|nr:DUF1376 domain-containing protein [Achromobacter xylosoxidans]ADP15383.1 hypothetical protein AXYL_02054 [Achromobacter xylosoxidans A8]
MTDFEQLLAPLTPPDCDLRDFAFMPLDVARLRDSDLAIQVCAEEFRAAVLLWCAAWHQVPAASLPDDDKALAALAGYGRVVAEWRKHREGALYGWVKCDDGRLYHPVVAEKARDAWQAKHKHAHDKLVDRVRKANKQREQQQLPPWIVPSLEDWIAAGFPLESELFPTESKDASSGKARKTQKQSSGNPPENALKGEGQGEGYKKDIAAAASLAQVRDPVDNFPPPPAAGVESTAAHFAQLLDRWERERGKAGAFHPGDPLLLAWADAGVTNAELQAAHTKAVKRRVKANDQAPVNVGLLDAILPEVRVKPGVTSAVARAETRQDPAAWALTWSGLVAQGADLGIVQQQGELDPVFKVRVHTAAGLTDADRARLFADYGVRV